MENLLLNLLFAIISAFIGFCLGVWYDRKISKEKEDEDRKTALNNLAQSLKENSRYITQMFTEEFPQNLYPSYPLDTVSLSLVTFDTSRFLGGETGWNRKYNKLRFEMDHINRKLLMAYISRKRINAGLINKQLEKFSLEEQYSLDPESSHDLFGVVGLLLATKKDVDAAIEELTRFGFSGYC